MAHSSWNDFRGTAKRIDDVDLPRLGQALGVGEDYIHAVIDVEASGGGFDPQGRPKILFEPHVFYRNLPKSKRQEAVEQGIAYPKWKPGTYGKESAQYGKLERALEIDEEAALKACSWGMAQVLGENHKMLGYDTVQEMVFAFMEDEENHLKGMVDFILSANLDDEIRAKNWEGFARGYNGPGYRVNRYPQKLRDAFAWWSKKKDTPLDPDEDDDMRKPRDYDDRRPRGQNNDGQRDPYDEDEQELEHRGVGGQPPIGKVKITKGDLRKLQLALYKKGYTEVGTADGVFGDKTKVALRLWSKDNKKGAITVVDSKLTREIEASSARFIPKSRAEVTPAELQKRGSKTIPVGRIGQSIGVGGATIGGIGAAIDGMTNQVETVTGSVTRVGRSLNPFMWMWDSIPGWVYWLAAALLFAGLAYLFHQLIWMRVMQERTGRTTTNNVKVETLNELEDDDNEPVTA